MTERHRRHLEEKILAFFKERPCLDKKCIEISSGIPLTTLGRILTQSTDRKLTAINIEKLIPVLKLYGFKDK